MSLWRLSAATKLLTPPQSLRAGKWTWARGREKAFGKYLLLTNTVGSGLLMAVGDLVQQHIEYLHSSGEEHKNGYDWTRNLNMSIIGFIAGPPQHYFYKYLDLKLPGTALKVVGKKILTDQLIASPFCIILFFVGMNYLNKQPFEKTVEEMKQKFLIVYATDWSVWVPSQFINFYWLGPTYRVMYINLVTMCYNVFLSYIKHVDQKSHQ